MGKWKHTAGISKSFAENNLITYLTYEEDYEWSVKGNGP
jgi:hypothetical protein